MKKIFSLFLMALTVAFISSCDTDSGHSEDGGIFNFIVECAECQDETFCSSENIQVFAEMRLGVKTVTFESSEPEMANDECKISINLDISGDPKIHIVPSPDFKILYPSAIFPRSIGNGETKELTIRIAPSDSGSLTENEKQDLLNETNFCLKPEKLDYVDGKPSYIEGCTFMKKGIPILSEDGRPSVCPVEALFLKNQSIGAKYSFRINCPGYEPDDIDIEIEDGILEDENGNEILKIDIHSVSPSVQKKGFFTNQHSYVFGSGQNQLLSVDFLNEIMKNDTDGNPIIDPDLSGITLELTECEEMLEENNLVVSVNVSPTVKKSCSMVVSNNGQVVISSVVLTVWP